MINSTERSDILVFNCYLCHIRYLLTCYVYSTKIGEISDISKCFENFVSQALGVLTRIYAAELRKYKNAELLNGCVSRYPIPLRHLAPKPFSNSPPQGYCVLPYRCVRHDRGCPTMQCRGAAGGCRLRGVRQG